jgi:hypothetical protein
LRPASQSPMPLRNAARTPLTLTVAIRSGLAEGMPQILREPSDVESPPVGRSECPRLLGLRPTNVASRVW